MLENEISAAVAMHSNTNIANIILEEYAYICIYLYISICIKVDNILRLSFDYAAFKAF